MTEADLERLTDEYHFGIQQGFPNIDLERVPDSPGVYILGEGRPPQQSDPRTFRYPFADSPIFHIGSSWNSYGNGEERLTLRRYFHIIQSVVFEAVQFDDSTHPPHLAYSAELTKVVCAYHATSHKPPPTAVRDHLLEKFYETFGAWPVASEPPTDLPPYDSDDWIRHHLEKGSPA